MVKPLIKQSSIYDFWVSEIIPHTRVKKLWHDLTRVPFLFPIIQLANHHCICQVITSTTLVISCLDSIGISIFRHGLHGLPRIQSPKFSCHAGPGSESWMMDPASRSWNVLKRPWIPAFAGMT